MRIPFGSRHRARQEALAWLARLKRGLRQGEGPELLAWLAPPSHRTLIAKAAFEWHGPEVLALLSELFPIDAASLEPRRGPHPAIMAVATAIAACITLLPLELGLIGHKLGVGSHLQQWYATTFDSTKRVTLEDGTRVALNRGSQIGVIIGEHIRSVFVARGEALFTVASEPYRTFDIRTAGRNFETKSAKFDVRIAGPNRLSLTVLAGTVTVFPPLRGKAPPILLEPLQMLIIEPDEDSGRTLTQGDVRARLAWQGGT